MKIALLVFPSLYDTHSQESAASDLGQRLEPSVLALASKRPEDQTRFISDNIPQDDVDLYLCSVYTRGWEEFVEFSKKVGRSKIIAGGYHPTARPMDTLLYAKKVVTGLCGNIEEIIEEKNGGIFQGKAVHRLMDRSLIQMKDMRQIYPDAMLHMNVGSSVSSVGCPYDCDFCATPQMSGRKMSSFDLSMIDEDIKNLRSYDTNVLFIRDESFATHPHFEEVVKMYGNAGFDVLYSFGTAAAMTDKKLDILANNNWHSLCLGLEDVAKSYKKNKTLLDVSEKMFNRNIGLTLSFIVDDRDKSLNEIVENYRNLTKAFFALKPIMVCANFFMPLPGTKLGDTLQHLISPKDWSFFDSKTPIFSTDEIQLLHRRLAVAVQLNWYRSKEYQKLRNFESGDTLHLRMLELEKSFGFEHGIPQDIKRFIE